ncbi:MAG: hypothetical protein E7112_01430 [Bacteroidales bacterium]|nr:hypothetical protein [Bacteroidales bacterium]
MKLLYKILTAAAGLLALSSCVEDAITPLTGKYEKPAAYELNTLKSQSVEKGDKTRTFTVEVSDGNATLNMVFVGDKYFLADGSYTPSPADQAKKNMYIVGNGGTTFNNIPVESGSIKVTQGTGSYTFSGILWLADESIVDFKSNVTLAYEPDPEPVKLTQVISATSNVANGTNSVTINLGTSDISSTMDPNTWQTVWTGEGNYLAVDFYSADGYLHPGTYKPSAAGGVIAEGEYGIGWDPGDLWGIGMVFENWGTCWWTVSNGTTTAEKISSGDIIVEKSGSKYTITYNHNGLWMTFSGKIEAVDPDGTSGDTGDIDDTEYVELTTLLSATVNQGLLTINMAQEGISSTTDPNTWQTIWEGEGNYLATDIYSADGKLYTGEYKACAEGGAVGEGEFGIGYDTTVDWGWGPMEMKDWGTCWWTVADGATTAEKVLDGTITVAVEGENLVIKLKSSLVNARFTCALAAFVDGTGAPIEVVNLGGGEPSVPEVEYKELVTLLSATSNVANGTNSVTINMATEGVEMTVEGWTTTYSGEGYYLALDVYSADGKLAAGTYSACAAGGAIAEGEFGIGWDPGDLWGMGIMFENWGTCWWTVSGGTTTAEKVLDGTLTVEVDSDTYTISLQSSTINAQYVGNLTL